MSFTVTPLPFLHSLPRRRQEPGTGATLRNERRRDRQKWRSGGTGSPSRLSPFGHEPWGAYGVKGKGNVVSRSRTTEVTSGERPGPFMKRDVKGSVTGPTSVSMSLPARPPYVSSVRRFTRFTSLPPRLRRTNGVRNGGGKRSGEPWGRQDETQPRTGITLWYDFYNISLVNQDPGYISYLDLLVTLLTYRLNLICYLVIQLSRN